MTRRSSNQFSPLAVAVLTAAWLGACLAPDAQQGKAAASGSPSGGTPGGSGGVGGSGGASPDVAATWLRRYGNGHSQSARAITSDASGNAIVAGIYPHDTLVIDPFMLPSALQTDTFVAKLDPDGVVLWTRNIGSAGDQTVNSIAVDPKDGSIVVAGGFTQSLDVMGCASIQNPGASDVFIVKLSSDDGSCAWSRAFGDGWDQSAFSVAVDAAQNIVLTGTFTGTLDFGQPTAPLTIVDDPMVNGDFAEIFVARLDKDGKPLGSRAIGDAPFNPAEITLGLTVDTSNDVLITGAFEGALAMSSEPIYNEGPLDLFLAKLTGDSLQSVWWHTSGDKDKIQVGRQVVADASNNIYFGGYFASDIKLGGGVIKAGPDLDAFIAAIDPSGTLIWGKRIGGIGGQDVVSLAIDGNEDLLLGGSFNGVLDFDDGGTLIGSDVMPGQSLDAFIAKLRPDGERIWSFQGTGFESQYTLAVAPAPNGVYAAGWIQGTATFGAESVTSAGAEDAFVLKLTD